MMGKNTQDEVQEQLRYLKNAHNVTHEERARVLRHLDKGMKDNGVFSWVKCPVWRLRLYELLKTGLVQEDILNSVFRYVLEGDKKVLTATLGRSRQR